MSPGYRNLTEAEGVARAERGAGGLEDLGGDGAGGAAGDVGQELV